MRGSGERAVANHSSGSNFPHRFLREWKGKLIVGWPPPERSWWRRAHRNEISVLAILDESALDAAMPEWQESISAGTNSPYCRHGGGRRSRSGAASISSSICRRQRLCRLRLRQRPTSRQVAQLARTGHGGNRLLKDAIRRTSASASCSAYRRHRSLTSHPAGGDMEGAAAYARALWAE